MIIISLLFSLVSNTTDLLYKYILESTSGYNVNIVNNGVRTIDIVDIINSLYSYFNISVRELNINMDTIKLGYLGNVINLTLRLIMNCSIGFLIGALSYRIKKIISTIICIGVPVVGVIWIIREFVTNNSIFVEKLVNRFLIPMAEFFASYNNVFLLESLTTSICIMGTILLLRKAPIKEYANDLI